MNIPRNNLYLLLLFSLVTVSCSADQNLSGDSSVKTNSSCHKPSCKEKECHSKDKCKRKVRKITQKDIDHGFTITKPGVYEFCGNLEFSPAFSRATIAVRSNQIDIEKLKSDIRQMVQEKGRITFSDLTRLLNGHPFATRMPKRAAPVPTAITIASNNVYIDMKNFKLEQGNTTVGAVGFWIEPGFEDISIVNGTVQFFQGAAIASFITTAANPTDQLFIKQLLFDNLTVVDNGGFGDPSNATRSATGISLETDFAVRPSDFNADHFYQDVQILNCNINRNTSAAVILLQASDITIQDSHMDHTYISMFPAGTGQSIVSLGAIVCENVRLINSTFNNTEGLGDVDGAFVGAIAGLGMDVVRNLYIDGCQFNNSNGNSQFVNGIVSGTIAHVLVQNSQFNNTTGIGFLCQFVQGFHMSDIPFAAVSGDGYRVVNCQFNGTVSSGGNLGYCQVSGTDFITCKDIVFENCQAVGSTLTGEFPFAAETFGFNLGTFPSNGVSVDQTTARNILFNTVTVGDISGPQDVVGISLHSQTENDFLGVATNYTVENSVISHIRTSTNNQPVAGILVKVADTGTLEGIFTNVFLKDNRISDVMSTEELVTTSSLFASGIRLEHVVRPNLTGNSISDCENGIFLLLGTSNGVVIGNEVDNCTNAGIVDTANPTTSTYLKNVVITCGTPSTDATNYDINWGIPAPIDHGGLSSGYPVSTNVWHNLSMTP